MKDKDLKNLDDLANSVMLVIAEAGKASIPLLRKLVISKLQWTSELED
jgi:hypothetical protein